MRVLVTGASGYIGGRLVPRLRQSGHEVRCLVRSPRRLESRFDADVELIGGDASDPAALSVALRSCDAAYYLIHSMGSTNEFTEKDRQTATAFGNAAAEAKVGRIVYLGGLGNDGESLSAHLRSRHEVGDLLREKGVPVVELRAAQIIGSGSVSFEMMRYLTERLPVMIAPRWVTTRCQPIGVRDVLAYLAGALALPAVSRTYEIGGPNVLTYREMMTRYAALRGLRRRIVVVPFFTPKLSSYWVHLITPIPAKLAQPLIAGLHNEVIVHDDAALRDFPKIRPLEFDDAVRAALDRSRVPARETTWFDAFAPEDSHADFTGLTEGMLVDRRVRESSATPEEIFGVFASLGGTRGWLTSNLLWRLRGALD
ncbi:MAG TPA: NAD(P)H-binding protein, partial [Candidatus Nitrosotalea sp.]|nr:NAD(P)H-binding protein [Candidatus Nitrosotalea sp.]